LTLLSGRLEDRSSRDNTASHLPCELRFCNSTSGGEIDVYDTNFAVKTLVGTFSDPNLPAGYAPFNVQNIGATLYVTYALQDAQKRDEVAGIGNGFVDKFDTNGSLLGRFVSQGLLNAPWGVALAPSNFGKFSNDILVGNFGDGKIHAYNATSGALDGTLSDAFGNAIVIDGLWALAFGNGTTAGDTNALYFTAGPNEEAHGLFGKLTAGTDVSSDVNLRVKRNNFVRGHNYATLKVRNETNGVLTGPVTIVFKDLPQGIHVANATGTTADGDPYITVSGSAAIHKSLSIKVRYDSGIRFFLRHSRIALKKVVIVQGAV
jgi:hypothetical protein